MTTPADRDGGAERSGDENMPGVDLGKSGSGQSGSGQSGSGQEPAFDPYRFGKPDRPIPPEYAPPGYVPEPSTPAWPPGTSPYGASPPQPGSPYGPQPGSPYVPQPGSPYGPQPGPYGQQFPPPFPGGYGAPQPPAYTGYPPPPAGNGKATAALVLGIVSIVMFWISFFNLVFLIPALILGVLGLTDSKRRHGAGRGLAIGGLVCAAVGFVASAVFSVVIVHAASQCGGLSNSNASGFQTCLQNHL